MTIIRINITYYTRRERVAARCKNGPGGGVNENCAIAQAIEPRFWNTVNRLESVFLRGWRKRRIG